MAIERKLQLIRDKWKHELLAPDAGQVKGKVALNNCASVDDRIDEQCDAFESACRNGEHPNIGDFITGEDVSYRNKLFRELLLVDVELRRSRGERPTADDYLRAFPKFASEIGAVSFLCVKSAVSTIRDNSAVKATVRKPGSRLAHFELVERLGTGAMGEAWKAWDTRARRNVTLKVPHGHSSSKNDLRRFLREGEVTGQLSHPQLAAVHAIENDGDTFFIVATFVEGKNLLEHASKKRLQYDDIANICAGIGEALQFAHDQGVVHRDLKPANIIIGPTGLPHIVDFGLAKFLDAEHKLTLDGELLGTLAYMSPELASGNSAHADFRTDIYSLGIILYGLLTGRCPFSGNRVSVVSQILACEPAPPRTLRAKIPRDLETICLTAVQKSPEKRYASARGMAEDLRRYAAGQPIRARRAGILEKSWRWICRHPLMTTSVLLALAAILAASATVASLQNRNKRLAGFRQVSITTTPAGARVALVPLDPTTNEPDLDPALVVRPSATTPLTTELKTGSYLVEAVMPGDRGPIFVEVYRTVSDSSTASASLARANQESGLAPGACRFRDIQIDPQSQLIEKMVQIVIPEGLRKKHSFLPAKLYVDAKQTIPAELASQAKFRELLNVTNEGAPCISYRSAIEWAELNQTRLPSAAEYDAIVAAAEHGEARSVETGVPVQMDDLFDDFPELSSTIKTEPKIGGYEVERRLRVMYVLKGFTNTKALSALLPWAEGALLASPDAWSPKISIRGVRSATPRFVKP